MLPIAKFRILLTKRRGHRRGKEEEKEKGGLRELAEGKEKAREWRTERKRKRKRRIGRVDGEGKKERRGKRTWRRRRRRSGGGCLPEVK